MKINKTRNEKYFVDIPIGGVFKFAKDFFIKIEEVVFERGNINGVKLETGDIVYFLANEKVEFYPDAELTL